MKIIKTENAIINVSLMSGCSLTRENKIRCDMIDGDVYFSSELTREGALLVLDLLVDFLTHDSDGCFDLGGS